MIGTKLVVKPLLCLIRIVCDSRMMSRLLFRSLSIATYGVSTILVSDKLVQILVGVVTLEILGLTIDPTTVE